MIFVVIFLTLVSIASAATVHGTVYNLLLESQTNAIVEVNSEPKQTFIAKNGEYSFNLPKGEYTITAKYMEDGELLSAAFQNVSIIDEGNFVLDLILFDATYEDFELLDTPNLTIDTEETKFPWLTVLIVALVLLLSGIGYFFYSRNKPVIKENHLDEKEVSKNELEQVLSIIKSESGRITQKDLRKRLNLSEAKVSLMVAELQSLGKVKKIKQGRGNIIILN